jgi:peptide/nickel transport system ATP-binding protein
MSETPVLEASELTKVYHMPRKGSNSLRQQTLKAVDNVSLQLFAGTTAALVGQSGSGKSTLVRLLSRLERPTSGEIRIDGEVTDVRRGRSYRQYTEQVQIVLQDPYASLNPGFRVGRSVRRPLEIHKIQGTRAERDAAVERLLEQVKLTPPEQFVSTFPHELSGGQRVLLADEPVSMLDVSVKVEILRVLNECRESMGLALLYVTHDIASARWCADTISVMYAGQIVETGPSDEVTQRARHPYTQLLIRSTPDPAASHADGASHGDSRSVERGPDREGCRFRSNCPSAMARCATAEPPVVQLSEDQWVRCFLYDSGPHPADDRSGAARGSGGPV